MSQTTETGLLALDVGSSRVKLGWFPPSMACTSESLPATLPIAPPNLPQPEETLAVVHRHAAQSEWIQTIHEWLELFAWQETSCLIASVCPQVVPAIQELLDNQARLLSVADLPLEVRVDQPDKVGIDRLLGAVAANRLRQPGRAAVTVGVGTAITVNRIAADGTFEGGAILPGLGMSAAALHAGTASLPQLSPPAIDKPPAPVGKSTGAAIEAGLYWGAVGAIRQLAERQSLQADQPPQVYVTGGDAALLAEQLGLAGTPAHFVPHMVLAGMAIVAEGLS
ncbi:MAG: type III pantothenate kinase [Pirellulales bacterium]|nr:type III pantothenate kinase [Pirellulales bacterium]